MYSYIICYNNNLTLTSCFNWQVRYLSICSCKICQGLLSLFTFEWKTERLDDGCYLLPTVFYRLLEIISFQTRSQLWKGNCTQFSSIEELLFFSFFLFVFFLHVLMSWLVVLLLNFLHFILVGVNLIRLVLAIISSWRPYSKNTIGLQTVEVTLSSISADFFPKN